jgi:hypothetical protein
MSKKYIVRSTDHQRDELATALKKLKGTSETVRRAPILLTNKEKRGPFDVAEIGSPSCSPGATFMTSRSGAT